MINAVSVKNLHKTYSGDEGWGFWSRKNGTEAVAGISFDIKKGEIFGLLGPNGVGKTTTINMLTGVITPTSGSIHIFGKPICGNEEELRQRMNISAGHTRLNAKLTLYENLRVYAEIYCIKDPIERIESLSKRFGITDVMDRSFHSVSSGQRVRTMIVKGLLNSPELLLLDEPTVGMDPDVAEVTRSALLEEQEKTGMTILLTSHYMSEVEELCDRVAMMQNGKIFMTATPLQLRRLIKNKRVEFWFLKGQELAERIFCKKGLVILDQSLRRTVIEVPSGFTLDTILPSLQKAGVRIRTIHTHEPDLKDVFIKIARGEIK